MKIKYLKLKSWLLVALGGLVGLNYSCDRDGLFEDHTSNAYGCPTGAYQVKGTVTNEQGQPIAGIAVGASYPEYEEYSHYYMDTTDAEGRYSLRHYALPTDKLNIYFDDIDSVENGYYQDTLATVEAPASAFHGGDGNWDRGTADITQNMVMTENTIT